jgi:hypothetical protein
MKEIIHMDYWAGLVAQARGHRKHFPDITDVFQHDPLPPANYTPERIEFALKLVAHWEGGLPPEDPAAVPVKLKIAPTP